MDIIPDGDTKQVNVSDLLVAKFREIGPLDVRKLVVEEKLTLHRDANDAIAPITIL